MGWIPGRGILLLAAALACAAPAAAQQDTAAHAPSHPRRNPRDPYRACPGQDSAMALIANRPPVRRRPQGMSPVTRVTREVVAVRGGVPVPAAASAHRPRGTRQDLQLQLQVDAGGRVTDVRVVQSSGELEVDQSFMDAARAQRFDPARESSFPVPGCAIQTINTSG
ncbi:MAG TPA: TonB family protein [Longimicrobium sp.]